MIRSFLLRLLRWVEAGAPHQGLVSAAQTEDIGRRVRELGKARMAYVVAESHEDMAELRAMIHDDLVEELTQALEAAEAGLLWYQDTYPNTRDGSDDEMNERIAAVLKRARGLSQYQPKDVG